MCDYIQQKQTELFEELGVFFAFSNEQFASKRKPGVKYCSALNVGDCVPVDNAAEFCRRLAVIHEEGREKELAEKGLDVIIEEHLVNYECFYTNDVQDAFDALGVYNVTYEDVCRVYREVRHKYLD